MGEVERMTEPYTRYTSAVEVLSDRVAWASESLASLIEEAGRKGWLVADARRDPRGQLVTTRLRARIDERGARTPLDVQVVPFEWLRGRLDLTGLEVDALWLLACVEIDPGVARLAQAFAVPECPDLSVQVLRQLLPLNAEDLDRLARLALIEMATSARLPSHRRYVRSVDRVIELASGELRLDRDVERISTLVPPRPSASESMVVPSASALVVATGIEGSGRATFLRRIASSSRRGVLEIRVSALAGDGEALARQLRAVAREAQLFDVIPLLRGLEGADARCGTIDAELLRTFPGLVMATAEDAPSWIESRPLVIHKMEPLDAEARKHLWRSLFADTSESLASEAAARYPVSPGAIVAAAENVKARGAVTHITIDDIHSGLRDHLGQKLGKLARRIEWKQTWNDLVLPETQREQVNELIARVRHRREVLEDQGFGVKVAKGHGVVALMSGEPGTGKTMVAGLIASELGLDLYQVDLSVVVSKYIGETEKGLAKLFDAAESGHVVLLFDEADALFAKRSEVKSSNDRYANLETNYLLQRLESFGGISILTTNNEAALDDAFRRRLAVHIKFPMPEEDERIRLWRAMFPPNAKLSGNIDLRQLAREFEMSGGHIKNAVLRAAYFAAASASPITMAHLRRATRAEYEAMGRIVTTSSL
ncbi:MAG: ATP-binding protein [Kofleriaceae bacterium]